MKSTEKNRTFEGQNSKMIAKGNINGKARFDTRVPLEFKMMLEKAATLGGFRNLTDFFVKTMQEKATEIIASHEAVLASRADAAVFFDAVMDPPAPNSALLAAAQDYQQLLSE